MNKTNIVKDDWLKAQIRESIRKELQQINEGFVEDVAGAAFKYLSPERLAKIGKIGDSYLGKVTRSIVINKVMDYLADVFNFEKRTMFGQIIRTALENMSFEQMINIATGNIECNDVVEIVTEVFSDMLTYYGVKELLAYILLHYDVQEIVDFILDFDIMGIGDIDFADRILPVNDFGTVKVTKAQSMSQAEQVLESLIGIVGLEMIEEFVFRLLKMSLIPRLSTSICSFFNETGGVDVEELAKEGGIVAKLQDTSAGVQRALETGGELPKVALDALSSAV